MKYICVGEFYNIIGETVFEKGKTYDVVDLGAGRYRVIPSIVSGYYAFSESAFLDYFRPSFKFGR